jgi:hypothetical protein
VLLWPQGEGAFHVGWEAILVAWAVLEGLQATGRAARLANSLRKRLSGAKVIDEYREALEQRGGGPLEVRKMIDQTAWRVEGLRSVMGLNTDAEARRVLLLYGCNRGEDDKYRFDDEYDECKFLRWAEEDVFALGSRGLEVPEDMLQDRFEETLRTGNHPQLPPSDLDR